MPIKLTRSSLTPGRSNWTKFRNLVSDQISLKLSLKTTLEIDKAVQFLTTTIQMLLWPLQNTTSIPKKTRIFLLISKAY